MEDGIWAKEGSSSAEKEPKFQRKDSCKNNGCRKIHQDLQSPCILNARLSSQCSSHRELPSTCSCHRSATALCKCMLNLSVVKHDGHFVCLFGWNHEQRFSCQKNIQPKWWDQKTGHPRKNIEACYKITDIWIYPQKAGGRHWIMMLRMATFQIEQNHKFFTVVISNTPYTVYVIYYNQAHFQELSLDPFVRRVESLYCNKALRETRGVQSIIKAQSK